jgi:lipoate-protein ligase A
MTQTKNSPQQAAPVTTWRLLDSGWQDGATNMAIDEAILEGIANGSSPPTLRFYGWQPPCLSLGYAQRWNVVDAEACAARGWDVVRRPTGGRAILHIDELTYSVCAPESEPRLRGGVLESYQRLSNGLAQGLQLMGLQPARAQPPDSKTAGQNGPNQSSAACFDRPSNYEITIAGRKLVGSAQARRLGVVLQHGTLPLYGDITRIVHGLAAANDKERQAMAEALRRDAITLESALNRRLSYDEAVHYMTQGFTQALNLHLEPGNLTAWEQTRTAQIRAEKYGNQTWTQRR